MKKYTKLVLCALLFCFGAVTFIYSSPAAADAYEDLFFYAKTLQDGGAYEQAQVEYKRYIFMQDYSTGIHQTEAFENLAELYALDEQWELAADTIQKAIVSSVAAGESMETTDELRQKHIIYLTNTAQKNKTKLSENLFVFSYMNLPDFSDCVRQAALRANILNLVQLELWQTAKNEFDLALQNEPLLFDENQAQIIGQNLENILEYKPKKQMLAGYLSLFPGLGQLYAGNYKDSLNAFILNGSLIAVSVFSIIQLDLWTFSLLEFNPLIHFMQGNIYNAQKDVYEYNTRKLGEFTAEILNVI